MTLTAEVARSWRAASRTGFREQSQIGSSLRASILHASALPACALRLLEVMNIYRLADAHVERTIAQHAL